MSTAFKQREFNLYVKKLGGKIPRNIKEKVIRQWLDGLTRENIAKENDIGAGTVTGIIQEAKKQEEYQDIDLLRQVSLKLKEEGLELPLVGFAIRVKRIVEENGINEDQIEPIIQDFAAYCIRHSVSYDTIIKSGREALYLEYKYGIPIEKIPEYITQGKETIDRLEDQRQEILRRTQQAREERDVVRQQHETIVAELEKYGKEVSLIDRTKQLEEELDKTKRSEKSHKTYCERLAKDVEMLDNLYVEHLQELSQCCKEIERLKGANEKLTAENRELKLDIYNIKTADKQLTENDSGRTAEGNKM